MIEWHAQTVLADAGELRSMTQLHQLTTRLISCDRFDAALDIILDSMLDLHGADKGHLQLYCPANRTLEIARQRGFTDAFLGTFKLVPADAPCDRGEVLRPGNAILIEDVERDPDFAGFRRLARAEGFRAVQAMPMVSTQGKRVGMLSTYLARPGLPSPARLYVSSLYAEQAADILARLRSEEAHQEKQELLTRELGHRVKNVLAMVHALSRHTLKEAPGFESHARAFEDRLMALGRAHSTLAEAQWKEAGVERLVREQLVAAGDRQIVLRGPDASLRADSAYLLTLLIHELGVNARKHGALSVGSGRLTIEWKVDAEHGNITFEWTESGGPVVEPPTSEGFGSALFRTLTRSELMKAEIHYEPEGLVCRFQLLQDA